MISWFSIRKNVRAMRLPREDRISQSPAPSESTSGFPTGQAHCTARISEPICFRFSTGRLFSHSLTGSLPDSVAKNRVASGRGAEAISLFVSKMMRVSKSECHTPAHLPRADLYPPGTPFFDSFAPAHLALRANLRLFHLAFPKGSIVVKFLSASPPLPPSARYSTFVLHDKFSETPECCARPT